MYEFCILYEFFVKYDFWSLKASATEERSAQSRNKVIWVLNMRVGRQWQIFHFCLNYAFNYIDRNRCLPILEAVIHNAALLKYVISPLPLQIPPTLTSYHCLSDFNNCSCTISVLFSLLLFWKHWACLASIIACQIPHYLKSCNMSFMESLCGTHTSHCQTLSLFFFFLPLCFLLFFRLSGLRDAWFPNGLGIIVRDVKWENDLPNKALRNQLDYQSKRAIEFKSNMLAHHLFPTVYSRLFSREFWQFYSWCGDRNAVKGS